MVWIAMLILEACTWMPKDANLISICRELLGKKGEIACWVLYLFLFYCLMIAHVAAGGGIVNQLFGEEFPNWAATLIYVAVFAPVVYLGTRAVDRLNIALMIGLAATYLLFLVLAVSNINIDFLARYDWEGIWMALPVVLTAFGFQNIIPTIYNYMERDHVKVRKAIWIGTAIPLALYVIWELLVLGIAPFEGPAGLLDAMHQGHSAVAPLQAALQNSTVSAIAAIFSFFAMTTSFVGIAIAFFDFWADGLKWQKKGAKRTGLLALVFAVPLVFVLIDPTIFFRALDLAGGIGMILLLGILPVLFVWSGRYVHRHSPSHHFIKGEKVTLLLMLAFCAFVLSIQLF
jgi:tyrosine-specific transport protein